MATDWFDTAACWRVDSVGVCTVLACGQC
uniref:Uncharacterized protein n=1 Tax=Anguilla anguilla TaxID=7936 RepID=A0A0E9PM84_ANGAN